MLEVNNLQVEGVSQPFLGEAIFSLRQGVPDLVGYVISRDEVDLSLTANYFEYVGNQPPRRPEQRRVQQLGGAGLELGIDTATDPSGNVYVTGTTTGTIQNGSTSAGFSDFWVAKYDSNGNLLWGRQFGSKVIPNTFSSAATSVDVDAQGNVTVGGLGLKNNTRTNIFNFPVQDDSYALRFDTNGNQQWFTEIRNPTAPAPLNDVS